MKPKTRTDATAPEPAKKLSTNEKRALEHGAEAEHSTGPLKEALIRQAKRMAEDPSV